MFALNQTVVLTQNIPESGLQSGDLGAVVAFPDPEHCEVEFVAASERTGTYPASGGRAATAHRAPWCSVPHWHSTWIHRGDNAFGPSLS